MLDWYDDARQGRWDEIVRKQLRMQEFIEASGMLAEGGHEHAAIAKALCAASGFLVERPTLRRPYLPIPPERVAAWKAVVADRFGDLAWSG